MKKKFVFSVSCILFALVSVVALIFADLLDRSFPVSIGARSVVDMDFSVADIRGDAAMESLALLSDASNLGLVKVLPMLGSKTSGEVFARVGLEGPADGPVSRFDARLPSRVEGSRALAGSFADGRYLLTGSDGDDAALREWMNGHHVIFRWENNGNGQVLRLLWNQRPFLVACVATICLMASVVLFWTASRSRGRALRVLGGVSSRRILFEDLGTFSWLVTTAALAVSAIAIIAVAMRGDWLFVPYYAVFLLDFLLVLIASTCILALVVATAAWPTAQALAARLPAAAGLGRASNVVLAASFSLLLVALGPTLLAREEARNVATQQSTWRSLADEVVLDFPAALGEGGFQRIRDRVGALVGDAERESSVLLSYTWTQENTGVPLASMSGAEAVTIGNSRWLEVMGDGVTTKGLEAVRPDELPESLTAWLNETIKPLVPGRDEAALQRWWNAASVFRYRQEDDPTAFAKGGNGDLIFPDSAIVIVVDGLRRHYDADFLASAATSRNLTINGFQRGVRLLDSHALRGDLQVRYMAESGILRAQFAAYAAWLCEASVVALVAAALLALMVNALIAGLLSARRDFAFRLWGASWAATVHRRAVRQLLVGASLVGIVLVLQWRREPLPILVAGLIAAALTLVAHILAARWIFARTSTRRL